MKIRTIITQDAEVDDQNSLRHFLFYANEVDLQGIVQTSSKFHWIGVEGAVKPEKKGGDDFGFEVSGPFDRPYRWTGTAWMAKTIDDYEKDYPNLCRQAEGYPTPDYLRSITKVGNIGYEGEIEAPTEGSELIRARILDDDERTLYLQVWGGCNTIVRALMDIQAEYEGTEGWEALHDKITKKVVITACGEQDGTYRSYLAEEWPDMLFVKTLQMKSYAYPWFVMPESDSKDTLKADFMKREILNGKSALANGYCTWLDGVYYEGEGEEGQFGANPEITKVWFGARMGLPEANQYDFLSEGDSPTYFLLFPWGFRTTEDFSYGGMSGRYAKVTNQYNSKGQPLNMWDVALDRFVGRDGQEQMLESMWPYVCDIQRDFAARIDWASKENYEDAEHAPTLTMQEGVNLLCEKGETIALHAQAACADKQDVTVTYRVYEDASAACAKDVVLTADGSEAQITVPADAQSGDQIHIVVKAQASGYYKLVHYQQVIITVR